MGNDPSPDPLMQFSNFTSVLARIDGIRATLEIARALSQAGRRLDLGGIDHEIGALCASVLDLDPAQGDRIRPLLCSLQGDLQVLEYAVQNV